MECGSVRRFGGNIWQKKIKSRDGCFLLNKEFQPKLVLTPEKPQLCAVGISDVSGTHSLQKIRSLGVPSQKKTH